VMMMMVMGMMVMMVMMMMIMIVLVGPDNTAPSSVHGTAGCGEVPLGPIARYRATADREQSP
jgi:hypothetical protein